MTCEEWRGKCMPLWQKLKHAKYMACRENISDRTVKKWLKIFHAVVAEMQPPPEVIEEDRMKPSSVKVFEALKDLNNSNDDEIHQTKGQ